MRPTDCCLVDCAPPAWLVLNTEARCQSGHAPFVVQCIIVVFDMRREN